MKYVFQYILDPREVWNPKGTNQWKKCYYCCLPIALWYHWHSNSRADRATGVITQSKPIHSGREHRDWRENEAEQEVATEWSNKFPGKEEKISANSRDRFTPDTAAQLRFSRQLQHPTSSLLRESVPRKRIQSTSGSFLLNKWLLSQSQVDKCFGAQGGHT